MAVIVATDRDGQTVTIEGKAGLSVMQVLKDIGGLDVAALCGGGCACATCHVHVDADWFGRLPAMDASENEMLDETTSRVAESRLSCQIPFTDALDGLRVTLAPED